MKMKFLYVLASLIVAAKADVQILTPTPGTTLFSGQEFKVELAQGIDTSPEAGLDEVSLVIGIVSCGTLACAAPSADLGEVLFIGQYQSQGVIGNSLVSFENFTFNVPNDIFGTASIQVQHILLSTPPGHGLVNLDYESVQVQIS